MEITLGLKKLISPEIRHAAGIFCTMVRPLKMGKA